MSEKLDKNEIEKSLAENSTLEARTDKLMAEAVEMLTKTKMLNAEMDKRIAALMTTKREDKKMGNNDLIKWEYINPFAIMSQQNRSNIIEVLNELGEQGWELVTGDNIGSRLGAVMKRRKQLKQNQIYDNVWTN